VIVNVSGPGQVQKQVSISGCGDCQHAGCLSCPNLDQIELDAVRRQLKAMPSKDNTFLNRHVGHGWGYRIRSAR